jgi:tRNA-splicing ligase RtcB (3'-phosphate/5'-hydroxy nucleic acid ligase)
MITGKTLIDWGMKPAKWFPQAIEAASAAETKGEDPRAAALACAPPEIETIPLRPWIESPKFNINLEIGDGAEQDNYASVMRHMGELMRVPTIVAGAVMPDACPSDPRLGYIPVGGVVAAREAIHPGMHSADICCSMAISVFDKDTDPKRLLDQGMKFSHFGGGGRPRGAQVTPDSDILNAFEGNAFLKPLVSLAIEHFATQGDGNHFFYVGRQASTGRVALVTHHGSRDPGAKLYSAGMKVADKFRRALSPETPDYNAWIPSETDDGQAYWEALQTVRAWTKASHFAIHDLVRPNMNGIYHRFWNEHNFVFRKTDGLFYHAKGATPAYRGFASDDTGLTLIPLNMAEPILITRGLDAPNGLGFAPHGAGRNLSRTAYMKANAGKTPEQMIAEDAPGIDVRYFCGVPDVSELPSAYKNAASVRAQISKFGLAEVVDTIEPIGNIMAGNWQHNAPWKKKADAKRAAKEAVQ